MYMELLMKLYRVRREIQFPLRRVVGRGREFDVRCKIS